APSPAGGRRTDPATPNSSMDCGSGFSRESWPWKSRLKPLPQLPAGHPLVAAGRDIRHLLPQAGEGHHPATPNNFLNPLSEKPCDTRPSSSTTTGRRISCGYSFSSSFHSASLPGVLRLGGSWRQVVDDLLTRASQPPAASFHATSVSGGCRWSR